MNYRKAILLREQWRKEENHEMTERIHVLETKLAKTKRKNLLLKANNNHNNNPNNNN